jgi:hypothetical protein
MPRPAICSTDMHGGRSMSLCLTAPGGADQSGRLEVSGNLHDLVVGPAEARSLIGGALIASRTQRGVDHRHRHGTEGDPNHADQSPSGSVVCPTSIR